MCKMQVFRWISWRKNCCARYSYFTVSDKWYNSVGKCQYKKLASTWTRCWYFTHYLFKIDYLKILLLAVIYNLYVKPNHSISSEPHLSYCVCCTKCWHSLVGILGISLHKRDGKYPTSRMSFIRVNTGHMTG